MERRELGRSGIAVSVLGLGCNAFGMRIGLDEAREVVAAALDEGVNFFDTADAYGKPFGASEEILGQALKDLSADAVIATKCGASPKGWDQPMDLSAGYVIAAVEASLRRLQVECIDLFQFHFPDPATPIEESLRAIDTLVRQGKVRAIGCSNFPPDLLREANAISAGAGLARFETTQEEYHLLQRDVEDAIVPALREAGMGLLPYFPLAGGLLTGKYRQGTPAGSRFEKTPHIAGQFTSERNLTLVEKLSDLAADMDCSLPDLAIGWLVAQDFVPSVIAGATRAGQVRANAASARRGLGQDSLAAIHALLAAA